MCLGSLLLLRLLTQSVGLVCGHAAIVAVVEARVLIPAGGAHRPHAIGEGVLLEQHWEATLASLFEMLQYQSPLLCAPNAFACLACTKSERYHLHDVQTKVLKALKTEWEMLLCLEQDAEGSVLLHRLCPQTTWQSYRELMVTFERESWQLTPWSVDMVLAWFPQVNCSSNIEDSFNTMQDACNRGGKSGVSSMANLQALHIRSVTQKMTGRASSPPLWSSPQRTGRDLK